MCEAAQVYMYTPFNEVMVKGVLTVTTFKMSFVSVEDSKRSFANCYQQNYLLGVSPVCTVVLNCDFLTVNQVNDVCLSNIESIYQLGERTRKKLVPGQSISSKVKELLIVCKVSG